MSEENSEGSSTEQTSHVDDALFPKAPLCRFLAQIDPAFADPATVNVTPFRGGASNLTALVSAPGRRLVVRRAPPGKKAKTAHDMVREARVISAVRPHFPLAPEVFAVCEDEALIGSPFFVMAPIEGEIPRKNLSVALHRDAARALCDALIACHVKLHGVDLEATGLSELGKVEGYVARQIKGWSDRYRAARTPDVPSCESIMTWLEANMPPPSGAALIHNDYKFDNVVLDPADPTRIVGVLDWEMATVGDPLMDLGASLAYWVQRDDPFDLQAIRTLPTTVSGMMTRAEVVARYAELSGREIPDFTFYYVYGLFRLAGIAQQIYLRYTLGQTKDPRFAQFGRAVTALSDQAHRTIRKAERTRHRSERLGALLSDRAFRLDGKVAVVVGGSRGIGEAVARLYAAQGAHVVVSSRKEAACELVAQRIRDAGGQASSMACHMGESEGRRAFVSRLREEFPRVDILVNNAATNPYFGHILDTPESMFEKTLDVNVRGFFHLSQLVGQWMRDLGGGVIINTASVNGVRPAAAQGIYSVTKAAIISMTKAFAKECAPLGIRVNAVLPGLTDTKFASTLVHNQHILQTVLPLIPEGRVADPEEIAPAFLFLATEAGSYVTGTDVIVDGGYLA